MRVLKSEPICQNAGTTHALFRSGSTADRFVASAIASCAEQYLLKRLAAHSSVLSSQSYVDPVVIQYWLAI